jgi:hypothetical protein
MATDESILLYRGTYIIAICRLAGHIWFSVVVMVVALVNRWTKSGWASAMSLKCEVADTPFFAGASKGLIAA